MKKNIQGYVSKIKEGNLLRELTIVGMLIFLTIVHFSYSPIITYDTAHYHTYLSILEGKQPWGDWNILRGITFPLIIEITHILFGYSVQGVLLLMFISYLILGVGCMLLVNKIAANNNTKYIGYLLVLILIMLNPIIIGYYHALLTEFVASTIAIVSCVVVWKWINSSFFNDSRFMFLICSIYFILMTPIAWHLKQPYITVALLPIIAGIIISVIDDHGVKNIILRSSILILVLLFLILSIKVWNVFLYKEGQVDNYKDSSQGLLAQQILNGLTHFKMDKSLNSYTEYDIKKNSKISEREKINIFKVMKNKSLKSTSRLVNVYGLNNELKSTMLFTSNSNQIKPSDSIQFLLKAIIYHPVLVMQGYVENYLCISNVYELVNDNHLKDVIIKKQISFTRSYENEAIAYRIGKVNENMQNIFYMPDNLYKLVSPYFQNMQPPVLSKDFIIILKTESNFMFSILFFMMPFIFVYLFLKNVIYKALIKKIKLDNMSKLNIILSFVVFFHLILHVIINAIIDRYAFPVYSLLIIMVILNIINNFGKLKLNFNKKVIA